MRLWTTRLHWSAEYPVKFSSRYTNFCTDSHAFEVTCIVIINSRLVDSKQPRPLEGRSYFRVLFEVNRPEEGLHERRLFGEGPAPGGNPSRREMKMKLILSDFHTALCCNLVGAISGNIIIKIKKSLKYLKRVKGIMIWLIEEPSKIRLFFWYL